ncbi:MAG: M48 family metallopeptidase [Candidatus Eisenbacteria bacterium]
MTRTGGPTRVVCAAIALALVAGCAIVPITGRRQLSLVSQPELIGMAAQNYAEFIAESTVSGDAEARNMVNEVGGRVSLATSAFMRENGMDYELSQYSWEFTLIEDDAANAFCMPGGKIVVFTGLLPVSKTKAGLSVVVAHEVAHAIANHGGERMSQLLLAELGGMALSKAIEQKPAQTRDLAMLAYGIGSQVAVLLPYSRQHESEADRIGLILMAKAGYDPREALQFWRRMASQSEGEPPELLSTHPSHSTRIDDIRYHLPEAVAIYEGR